MVNNLTWCGTQDNTTSGDGIDYSSCPASNKNCDYITHFWGQASERVSSAAEKLIVFTYSSLNPSSLQDVARQCKFVTWCTCLDECP